MSDIEKASTTGNPVAPLSGQSYSEARVSPSRVVGGQARSVDDHGDPMNVPGPRALAMGHPSMRMGTTGPVPLLSMRTDATDFPRDLQGMSSGVPIALSRLDAYSAAGAPDFRAEPSGHPGMRRMDHIAPGNAVGEGTGRNTLSQPEARHPQSMKASDRREIMRRHMFPGVASGEP